ncbi:hypothetical protein MASR2M18_12960 [Ignavibacteria bacterium]|jgi:anionic cell wall polymer biosynthesis LytR-Cps2A-Psr (LCP) family protein|nr:LCP family protein [Bacteroidota bacterium]MCZ2132388.1 LCP family protein [Bacteroidota bacterium]
MTILSRRITIILLSVLLLLGAGGAIAWLQSAGGKPHDYTTGEQYSAPKPQKAIVQPIAQKIAAEQANSPELTIGHDTAIAEASCKLTPEPPSIKGGVRRINIAVIGVDSRIGDNYVKHADANHILSIIPDSGRIEITSIPRDTYADAGYNDTTGLNKLTLVYANRGLRTYLKEATRIAELDKIDYWVEVGFSQAMGVIELFGHKNSKSALQVLRSRQGLGGDDYQRCYNQGQFIRQNILRHFNKFDGFTGDLLLRGGLLLVNTNLNKDKADEIFEELKEHGFPKDSSAVTVRVRPRALPKYKVYDFTKDEVYNQLQNKIERYNEHRRKHDTSFFKSKLTDVSRRLSGVIKQARADSAKRPQLVINKLRPYFEQRAWLQIPDHLQREAIRGDFETLLVSAYERLKKPEEAKRTRNILDYERKLFAPSAEQAQKK